MQTEFVKVIFDIYCDWEGTPPIYRVFVNDELFTERTWIWTDRYLEESIQINAPPGEYQVRYELVDPEHAAIKVRNLRIETGPAIITRYGQVQIYTPERPT